MRRTTTALTALVAALSLAACSADTGEDTETEGTQTEGAQTPADTAEETEDAATQTADAATETAAAGGAADDAAATSDGAMSDPVCQEFFEGMGQPLAERAGTTRDLLETGDPLDPVSYSELSLLQSRIDMLGQDASGDQTALLERINAPFTEVVDAVVADDARLEEEISVPDVDVEDSAAAQQEFEAACAG